VDLRVRDAVRRQLDWEPEVDASAVGVAAKDGTVTLTGYIDTYAGKLAAERAAKRVKGVRAIANDVDVRLRLERTDADIAADIARALVLRSTVPETVQATVRNGHVTLTGTVNWAFQKRDAEKVIRHIHGVRETISRIVLEPGPVRRDVSERILEALTRNAQVDARRIAVTVSGTLATLEGTVGSWQQRDAAERAAGDAPGIARVDNQIVVEPSSYPEGVDEIC
jgi:osmotically-inducible protein OsmY